MHYKNILNQHLNNDNVFISRWEAFIPFLSLSSEMIEMPTKTFHVMRILKGTKQDSDSLHIVNLKLPS